MTLQEQFTDIITNQQSEQYLPFLKALSPDQKKILAPTIKKLSKEYSQFGPIGDTTWGHIKGTEKQRNMLQIASFVCLNLADYEKSPYSVWMLDEKNLNGLIDWYVPTWFSDFVNKQADADFLPYYISYEQIMKLTEQGALKPSRELLVKAIPQMIFENQDRKTLYKPENLLKRPITLQEHIWHLFELESSLHYSDRFLHFGKEASKETLGWKRVFINYSQEGKIDRQRLLKESLLAANKNFNKVLSGWFAQLFTDLQPSSEEILRLQKELVSILSSPHSKVVNTSLQMIKKILSEKDFDISAFMDATPALLTAETKATVASALMILEKIAKTHKELREQVAIQALQAFVHADEELQAKAAKIIADNNEYLQASFQEALAPFQQSMLASARKILLTVIADIPVPSATEDTYDEQESPESIKLKALAAIPPVDNLDDLVFLASHVFDNNETWHFEQLVSSLVQFCKHLKEEDIPRFEPAFQRALNVAKNGTRSNMGHLEHLLAVFFIDFGNYLFRRFPTASASVEKVFRKYDYKDGEMVRSWTIQPENSSYTRVWEPYSKIEAYKPYQHILLITLSKFETKDDLPLLCTPTHAPGWIMPGVLIDRLYAYQQQNLQPDDLDWQIAISRCYLKDVAGIENSIDKLSGEYKRIMQFLLEDIQPSGPFTFKSAWMAASLSKKEKKSHSAFNSFSYYKKPLNNYKGELRWESVDEEYTTSRYDYNLNKSIDVKDRHKILRVFKEKEEAEKKQAGLKKILSGLLTAAKDDPPLLYSFLMLNTRWLSVEHNDVKRFILLAPNNPGPMLADIVGHCLQYPTFSGEPDKKLVIASLQLMHELWDEQGEMAYLLIGTSMIASDKTVQNIAAEIWINAVAENKMNNEKLGEIIGRHESIEFAPLKRFTDLVAKQLFRISEKHNRALQVVVENILKQLPDKPITNLKKLLEIYAELLAVNKYVVNDSVIKMKLAEWKGIAGLQKLIEGLK